MLRGVSYPRNALLASPARADQISPTYRPPPAESGMKTPLPAASRYSTTLSSAAWPGSCAWARSSRDIRRHYRCSRLAVFAPPSHLVINILLSVRCDEWSMILSTRNLPLEGSSPGLLRLLRCSRRRSRHPAVPSAALVLVLAVFPSSGLRTIVRVCLVARSHVWSTHARRPTPSTGLSLKINVHATAVGPAFIPHKVRVWLVILDGAS